MSLCGVGKTSLVFLWMILGMFLSGLMTTAHSHLSNPVKVVGNQVGEKIIKTGQMRLLVTDTSQVLRQVDELMRRYSGEVSSSTQWTLPGGGKSYLAADLTLKVPSSDFEALLLALRRLGMAVLEETSSGENVTLRYTDLLADMSFLDMQQSRLTELHTDAEDEDTRLRVQEDLADLEIELSQVENQIRLLDERVEYATLSLSLKPFIPTATPKPTLTPMPTLTPIPWSPQNTFRQALAVQRNVWSDLFESWYIAVPICLCLSLPLAGVVVLFRFLRKKRQGH